MTTPQPSEEQPSLNDSKALDKRPEYGVFADPSGGVSGLPALQRMTESSILFSYRQKMKRDYKPFAELLGGFDKRLTEAQTKVDKAIADLGDGYDPGELTAYVDAEITKISALVSKNAADIAGLAVASTDEIVKIVTDGMNGVLQGAAGAAGQVADAFATAFNRMVNALTGKNLGYWDAEIYTSSSTVYPGFNDTPLGIVKSFNGLITDMIVRVGAVAQLEGEGAPTLTLGLFVNGKEKESLTITGETTLRGALSGKRITMNAGDVIDVQVKSVVGEYIGMSVMLAGMYL